MPRHTTLPALIASADRRAPLLMLALLAVLLLGGTLYSLRLGDGVRYRDEMEYAALATNIAAGLDFTFDGSRPVGERPPGYPLLLTPLAKLGAGMTHFRITNFVLLAATALLAYGFVSRLATPLAGLLAAACVAFNPLAFYTAGALFPQTLAACLLLAALALLLSSDLTTTRVVMAGLALGLLVLAIPNFIAQLGILAAFLYWRQRRLASIALLVAPTVLFSALWTVRNLQTFDQVFFISANSGINLLHGNSKHTTPNSGTNIDLSDYTPAGVVLSPVELDSHYRNEAIKYIRAHKQETAKLYALKVLNYFNFHNELSVRSEMGSTRNLIAAVTYLPLLIFVLVRLALCIRVRITQAEALIYTIYFSNALIAAVFFTRIRFRVPFDALLIVAAVLALDALRRHVVAGRRARTVTQPATALAGSYFSVHRDADAFRADAYRGR